MSEERQLYNTHGGPGRRQGRKKGSLNKRPAKVKVSFRLTREMVNWLESFPSGQRSRVIEEALEKFKVQSE